MAELVARGVIASFGEDVEGWKTFRGAKFDLDFAPAGVMRLVARMVSQNILITQLHANFRRNVREILNALDGENAAAGHISDVGQERRPIEFFRCPIAISKRVENSDGV